VPALPGCVTERETSEEVVAMAEEAIEGYLGALARMGARVAVQRER
jgi:predicted RNase H-like HicB family nuclease